MQPVFYLPFGSWVSEAVEDGRGGLLDCAFLGIGRRKADAADQVPVGLDERREVQVDWVTLAPDADDVQHAQVAQLVQHHSLVVRVGLLLRVGFDASNVPAFLWKIYILMLIVDSSMKLIENKMRDQGFVD